MRIFRYVTWRIGVCLDVIVEQEWNYQDNLGKQICISTYSETLFRSDNKPIEANLLKCNGPSFRNDRFDLYDDDVGVVVVVSHKKWSQLT